MDFLDLLFIDFYFGIILWIARWASNEKKGSTFSSVDYILQVRTRDGWSSGHPYFPPILVPELF